MLNYTKFIYYTELHHYKEKRQNVRFVQLPDLTNCANDAMKLSVNAIYNGQQEIT